MNKTSSQLGSHTNNTQQNIRHADNYSVEFVEFDDIKSSVFLSELALIQKNLLGFIAADSYLDNDEKDSPIP
jgi:hypothetical protein